MASLGRRRGGSGHSGWREERERFRRMARRTQRRARLPPVPPPLPPGRVVAVPGRGEMFVREQPGPAGGPVLLLLHGWTATADLNFFPVYETVGRLGHVLALDHRGHGRGLCSEEPYSLETVADDAAALLRHLGLGPVVAMGYSMGGPVAMLLWRRHPDLVAGLVLAATALEWRASRGERAAWAVLARLELGFRLGPPRALLESYLAACIDECPELEPWRAWLMGEYRRGDAIEVAAAARAISRYDARPFAGDIDVPTSVIVTTGDHLVWPAKQAALAHAIPRARRFELDGDHDSPMVRPAAFRTATQAALESVLERMGP